VHETFAAELEEPMLWKPLPHSSRARIRAPAIQAVRRTALRWVRTTLLRGHGAASFTTTVRWSRDVAVGVRRVLESARWDAPMFTE
jgi:hypothetical protein